MSTEFALVLSYMNDNYFISYNWTPTIAHHVLDASEEFYRSVGVGRLHNKNSINPMAVQSGDILCVKTDYIYDGTFQREILPFISNPFVLITGISSYCVSKGFNISSILDSPMLIRWFCTNCPDINHPKLSALPIGFEEKERAGGSTEALSTAFKSSSLFAVKKSKILLPYHTSNTNPQRLSLVNAIGRHPFVEVQTSKLPFKDYLSLLDKYKFVICLEGSGPDVHRNYETLLVHSVPINIKNVIQPLFEAHDLPGLFLDSWSQLTDRFFSDILDEDFSFENSDCFLTQSYHKKIIYESRSSNR